MLSYPELSLCIWKGGRLNLQSGKKVFSVVKETSDSPSLTFICAFPWPGQLQGGGGDGEISKPQLLLPELLGDHYL